jgi:hypothetical protein
MKNLVDGPSSLNFRAIPLEGNRSFEALAKVPGISTNMVKAAAEAPRGECVAWGIPFQVGQPVLISNQPVRVILQPFKAPWLVFMHTSDIRPLEKEASGLIKPPIRGAGHLNEQAAVYIVEYANGSQERLEIRRCHQVGAFERGWGANCFQAVEDRKPFPVRAAHEQASAFWGGSQTRNSGWRNGPWVNWLWAWENPHPEQEIVAVRFEPAVGVVVISGLAAGSAAELPLRWRTRRKALLTLPEGIDFKPDLDEMGRLEQVRLDMGQVISAQQAPIYPHDDWEGSFNNQLPGRTGRQILLEYTSHPDACFHLGEIRIPVAQVEAGGEGLSLQPVAAQTQRVVIHVTEKGSQKPVAVKLHLHGEAGEYLAPIDRHRIINWRWFEDYSADFTHLDQHPCTYIPGETVVDLPLSKVYLEVSKGFEIRPVRKVLNITPELTEIEVEVEKVLPWREHGWVTADTHVHFLSPTTAMLEGAGEGVNIINLLASQWGELMTNVGDFNGRTTWGAKTLDGGPEDNGEYLVRVGTENRQHVLGHISLLGYDGRIIAPMTTGGVDEAALGDPVGALLTEWAAQCKRQGGLVVLPHFPNPRAEFAAAIVSGGIDAVEMTSWEDLYSGINPYSLSDWYRFLNCGYRVAAVGGTDKMYASTAVGTVRTYAHIPDSVPFTYAAWMDAVRRAETFVTYGPLLEMRVDGKPLGSRIALTQTGGTLDVTWEVASVTIPMTRVELVVNGEIRESQPVDTWQAAGSWRIRVDRSSWLALLVRAQYPGKAEVIAAHSSPVMAEVAGSPFMAAADAVTILEQIEGALAFIDTVGTRAEDRVYKRMRLALESAHRSLHNRIHEAGHYHEHAAPNDHTDHH